MFLMVCFKGIRSKRKRRKRGRSSHPERIDEKLKD